MKSSGVQSFWFSISASALLSKSHLITKVQKPTDFAHNRIPVCLQIRKNTIHIIYTYKFSYIFNIQFVEIFATSAANTFFCLQNLSNIGFTLKYSRLSIAYIMQYSINIVKLQKNYQHEKKTVINAFFIQVT